MSEPLRSPKSRPWHLDRTAGVYVRQSTPQQVLDHQESSARQYTRAYRAVSLGWTGRRAAQRQWPKLTAAIDARTHHIQRFR